MKLPSPGVPGEGGRAATNFSEQGHETSMAEPRPFHVALTADFYNADGSPRYPDLGLSVFQAHPHIRFAPFAEHRKQIGADQLAGAHGVIVLTPAVTAETV